MIASSIGPPNNFMRSSNVPGPVVTQASVQHPRTQGKAYAVNQLDAHTSNAIMEGTIILAEHTAWTLLTLHYTCIHPYCIYTHVKQLRNRSIP